MAENKEYLSFQEDEGKILISEEVISTIATAAAQEVDGFGAFLNGNVGDLVPGRKNQTKGVKVENTDSGLVVNIYCVIKYGYVIGDVAKQIQNRAFDALADMSGDNIVSVNVHVGGISFNEK